MKDTAHIDMAPKKEPHSKGLTQGLFQKQLILWLVDLWWDSVPCHQMMLSLSHEWMYLWLWTDHRTLKSNHRGIIIWTLPICYNTTWPVPKASKNYSCLQCQFNWWCQPNESIQASTSTVVHCVIWGDGWIEQKHQHCLILWQSYQTIFLFCQELQLFHLWAQFEEEASNFSSWKSNFSIKQFWINHAMDDTSSHCLNMTLMLLPCCP